MQYFALHCLVNKVTLSTARTDNCAVQSETIAVQLLYYSTLPVCHVVSVDPPPLQFERTVGYHGRQVYRRRGTYMYSTHTHTQYGSHDKENWHIIVS